ncbi:MAG: EFR1 family ferrodoxin [Kiritimatiellae bacterium]|nr:EFR1 family ferrodoxin [Kiritimatiellia bacterium]
MIIYFTGTGNSLAAARRLAQETSDKAVSLRAVRGADLSAERRVGIVFPVYCFDTPPPVREFLGQAKFAPDAYIYVVATCGASVGRAIQTAVRLIAGNGAEVALSRKLPYPDSASVAVGANANPKTSRCAKAKAEIDVIAQDIEAGRRDLREVHGSAAAALAATRAGRALVSWAFRQEPDPSICNGCGLCAKVCPCSNIEVADGHARIRDRVQCAHCMACVQFCPRQAMTIRGRRVRPELQYHHPGVTAAALFA